MLAYAHCLCSSSFMKPSVIWIDNFSKIVARQTPSVDLGVFSSMLSCGMAVRVYDGQEVSMDLVQNDDGSIVSAMPVDLFPLPEHVLKTFVFADVQLDDLFTDCLAHIYDVQCVPPKLDPSKVDDEALRKRMSTSRDGLSRLETNGIIPLNPGSNAGLVKILKHLQTEHGLTSRGKYFILSADLNIFMRTLKVCVRFNSFCVVSLLACRS